MLSLKCSYLSHGKTEAVGREDGGRHEYGKLQTHDHHKLFTEHEKKWMLLLEGSFLCLIFEMGLLLCRQSQPGTFVTQTDLKPLPNLLS